MPESTLRINRAKAEYQTNSILAHQLGNGTHIMMDLAQILPLVVEERHPEPTQAGAIQLRLAARDILSGRTTQKTVSRISQGNLAIPLLPPILKEGLIPALRGPTTNKDRDPLARDPMEVFHTQVTAMQCLSTQRIKDRTLNFNLHGPPINLGILSTPVYLGTLTKTQVGVTLKFKEELLKTLNKIPTIQHLDSPQGVELIILDVIRIPTPVGLLLLAMFLMVSIFSLDHLGKTAQQLSGQ